MEEIELDHNVVRGGSGGGVHLYLVSGGRNEGEGAAARRSRGAYTLHIALWGIYTTDPVNEMDGTSGKRVV